MNVIIGYIQSGGDFDQTSEHVAHLRGMGAQVVRIDECIDDGGLLKPSLNAICDFIGPGDELIIPDLRHLGETVDAVLHMVRRIEARGATLSLLEPEVSTSSAAGQAVIKALEQTGCAAEAWTSSATVRGAREVDTRTILALRAHGFGPSQIAKKLGISRMTVWRKLAKCEV